jgi:hypothetical protein
MFNNPSALRSIVWLIRLAFIALAIVMLASGCDVVDDGGTGAVYLSETSSSVGSVTTETIQLDNCGNQEKRTETLKRSLDIEIGGSVGVAIKVLEAELNAKYARGQEVSIDLPAAPGTNMEYVIEWTEEAFFGKIAVNGQSGHANYRVGVTTPRKSSAFDRGCIYGVYDLFRWEEAPSPVALYMDVDSGKLIIEPFGDATWTLAIRKRGEYPTPQPTIKCLGRYYQSSLQLEGRSGGHDADWTSDMIGFADDLHLVFCGRSLGGNSDPFDLYPREMGGGQRELEMRNSKGTMIWQRRGP